MDKPLIIGYGNVDRQDDGVAWHVLQGLAKRIGAQSQEEDEGETNFLSGEDADLLFVLQLTPELGEQLSHYQRICFVDAHTGDIAEDIHFSMIQAEFQKSPLTHHMTPQTVLAISSLLYGHQPNGYMLSIRGYEFGFSTEMSDRTTQLTQEAIRILLAWIYPENSSD